MSSHQETFRKSTLIGKDLKNDFDGYCYFFFSYLSILNLQTATLHSVFNILGIHKQWSQGLYHCVRFTQWFYATQTWDCKLYDGPVRSPTSYSDDTTRPVHNIFVFTLVFWFGFWNFEGISNQKHTPTSAVWPSDGLNLLLLVRSSMLLSAAFEANHIDILWPSNATYCLRLLEPIKGKGGWFLKKLRCCVGGGLVHENVVLSTELIIGKKCSLIPWGLMVRDLEDQFLL